MYKTVAVAIGCILLALTWAALSGNQPVDGMTTPDDTTAGLLPSAGVSGGRLRAFRGAESAVLTTGEDPEPAVSDSSDGTIKSLAEVFEAFESASAEGAAEEPRLTLDHFYRPYSMTMTETGFAQLSPEDKSIAIDEIADALRQARSEASDTYAQADADIADGHYDRAETALVSECARAGEFNANKEGLYLTRIIGVSYQQRSLKRLETLYAGKGDHRKLKATQQQWQDLESEKRRMQAAQVEQAD